MLASEWCLQQALACDKAGDIRGYKAYKDLEALWKKREDEKRSKLGCVCGKSSSGLCVGLCATGEQNEE